MICLLLGQMYATELPPVTPTVINVLPAITTDRQPGIITSTHTQLPLVVASVAPTDNTFSYTCKILSGLCGAGCLACIGFTIYFIWLMTQGWDNPHSTYPPRQYNLACLSGTGGNDEFLSGSFPLSNDTILANLTFSSLFLDTVAAVWNCVYGSISDCSPGRMMCTESGHTFFYGNRCFTSQNEFNIFKNSEIEQAINSTVRFLERSINFEPIRRSLTTFGPIICDIPLVSQGMVGKVGCFHDTFLSVRNFSSACLLCTYSFCRELPELNNDDMAAMRIYFYNNNNREVSTFLTFKHPTSGVKIRNIKLT